MNFRSFLIRYEDVHCSFLRVICYTSPHSLSVFCTRFSLQIQNNLRTCKKVGNTERTHDTRSNRGAHDSRHTFMIALIV